MKKCKLTKPIPGSVDFLDVNKIYNYQIFKSDYFIYNQQNRLIGTFIEKSFETLFITNQEIRKLKLKQIYKNES